MIKNKYQKKKFFTLLIKKKKNKKKMSEFKCGMCKTKMEADELTFKFYCSPNKIDCSQYYEGGHFGANCRFRLKQDTVDVIGKYFCSSCYFKIIRVDFDKKNSDEVGVCAKCKKSPRSHLDCHHCGESGYGRAGCVICVDESTSLYSPTGVMNRMDYSNKYCFCMEPKGLPVSPGYTPPQSPMGDMDIVEDYVREFDEQKYLIRSTIDSINSINRIINNINNYEQHDRTQLISTIDHITKIVKNINNNIQGLNRFKEQKQEQEQKQILKPRSPKFKKRRTRSMVKGEQEYFRRITRSMTKNK